MKKNYKLLLSFILLFSFFTFKVNAREMTIAELGNLIENEYDGFYAFIIGNYVFTDEHILTTQDIMLASRSIAVEDINGHINTDPIYKEMNIYYIVQEFDSKNNLAWKVSTNLIGSNKITINTKLNINFINYNQLSEGTKFDITLEDEDFNSYISDNLKFTGGNKENSKDLSLNDKRLSGLVFNNNTVNPDEVGNYFSFIINVPNANTKTTVKIDGVESKEYTYSDFKTINGKTALPVVWKLDASALTKTIKVTVDLDGKDLSYDPTSYVINYEDVTYPLNSSAEFNIDIPYEDKVALKDWGYKVLEDQYTLTKSESNIYDLNGTIVRQHTNEGVFAKEGEDAYYFAFTIKLTDYKDDVTITIPAGKNQTKTIKKSDLSVDGSNTVLFKLNNECNVENEDYQCLFVITVDLDGDGKEYVPVDYIIDYKNVLFEEPSPFKIEQPNTEEMEALSLKYAWEKGSDYRSEFTTTDNIVNVTGLIPYVKIIKDENHDFTHLQNHYLAYVITSDKNITDKTTIKFLADGDDDSKEINGTKFTNNKMVILKPLHPDDDRVFEIELDLDGSETKYAPTKLTVDWTNLNLQTASFVTSLNIAPEEEIASFKNLKDLNYDSTLTELNINENTLTGSIKEQPSLILSDDVNTGYYIPLLLTIPADMNDVTLKVSNTNYGKTSKVLTSSNFEDNQIIIFFAINKDKTTNLEFTIDLDGNNHIYNEVTYKLDYSKVTLKDEVKINYDYGLNVNLETKKYYEGDPLEKPEDPSSKKLYHEFAGWYKDNEEFNFEDNNVVTSSLKDITLKAHWLVSTEDLLLDLVNYYNVQETKADLSYNKEEHELLYEILEEQTITINDFKEGIIPKVIKYVMEKDEVASIKLTANSKEVTFTPADLDNVNTKFANFIDEVNTDNKTYLDDLIDKKYEISIEIGDLKSPVDKYKNNNDQNLKIDFTIADHDEVSNEQELLEAINKTSSNNIHSIIITDSFNITNPITISKNVIIKGQNKKLTYTSSSPEPMFKITALDTSIYNLTIKGNESSNSIIEVNDNASLIINDVKIDSNTGLIVKNNGHLNTTKLTYEQETYDKPVVKASKNAKVNIDGGTKSVNYMEVVPYENLSSEEQNESPFSKGDKLVSKPDYNYVHYYTNNKNSIGWYKLSYQANRDITTSLLTFNRYYKIGEEVVPEPPLDFNYLTSYSNSYSNYVIDEWCMNKNGVCAKTGELSIPTSDTYYTAKLKGTLKENVREVSNEEDLKAAIQNENISTVIIKGHIVLNEVLEINHSVYITGLKTGEKTNQGSLEGMIKSTKGNLTIENLTITGKRTTTEETNNIITVLGDRFRIYKVTINANSEFDNAIYISKDNPSNVIYFSNFNSNDNIKTFINFASNIDNTNPGNDNNETRVVGNVFNGSSCTKNHIIMNQITSNSIIGFSQNEFNFANAGDYGLLLNVKEDTSNVEFTIYSVELRKSLHQKFRIGLDVTTNKYSTKGYKFSISNTFSNNLELKYLLDTSTSSVHPNGVEENAIINIK